MLDAGEHVAVLPLRIPHQPPLRLLTGEVELTGDGCRCTGRVAAGSPAADGDAVRPAYLIEIAAQGAAAFAAAAAEASVPGSAAPIAGMLVGVKEWRLFAAAPVATDISVIIRQRAALGALRQFDAELGVAGRVIARGSLQVHIG